MGADSEVPALGHVKPGSSEEGGVNPPTQIHLCTCSAWGRGTVGAVRRGHPVLDLDSRQFLLLFFFFFFGTILTSKSFLKLPCFSFPQEHIFQR